MYHGEDALKALAMSAGSQGIGNGASEAMPRATLTEAIGSAEALHGRLADTASFAERLADAVAGSAPSPSEGKDRNRPHDGMVLTIVDRVIQCHEPAARIHLALERIGRALG